MCVIALSLSLQESNLQQGQMMLQLNLHHLPLRNRHYNKSRVRDLLHLGRCTSAKCQSPFHLQVLIGFSLSPQMKMILASPSHYRLGQYFTQSQGFKNQSYPLYNAILPLSALHLFIPFTAWCREYSWTLICH